MRAFPNLKQILEKSYILAKSMKLNAWMKEWFPAILYSFVIYFCFKLHQTTNMYNDDRNGSREDCNGCGDIDESLGYDIIDGNMS